MEDEFKAKLKETLETMDTRLRQLEHLVNDVIIGSLESAANEYADNEAYNSFKGNYGESLKDLVEPYKKLFGEDYDLERNLYDDLKATEGYGTPEFDEKSCMEARIADLKARIDSLKDEAKEVVEEVKEEEPKKEEITEEQLAEELKKAMEEGGI